MLPFFEQGTIWNAYNSTINSSTHPANITIAGVGLSVLWCPSDPRASSSLSLTALLYAGSPYTVGYWYNYVPLPPGNWSQYSTNYRVCVGIYSGFGSLGGIYNTDRNVPAITIASVTDGTSNTLAFSEQYYTCAILLPPPPWNTGDTPTFSTVAPPNF